MLKFIRSLSRDEAGVSAIEYGILAALISLAVIARRYYCRYATQCLVLKRWLSSW